MLYNVISFLVPLVLLVSSTEPKLVKHTIKVSSHQYSIRIPDGNYRLKTFRTEHGAGFEITYADSSMIYCLDDGYSVSPTARYYSSCIRCFTAAPFDTTMSGLMPNGNLWKQKEIQWRLHWGYINVSRDKQALYNKAIATFNKEW